jgi:hypothetical protein
VGFFYNAAWSGFASRFEPGALSPEFDSWQASESDPFVVEQDAISRANSFRKGLIFVRCNLLIQNGRNSAFFPARKEYLFSGLLLGHLTYLLSATNSQFSTKELARTASG